jgi:hypothetical protein
VEEILKIVVIDLEETKARNNCAGQANNNLTNQPKGPRWELGTKTGLLTVGHYRTLTLNVSQ